MGKEKQKLKNFALPVNITDNLIEWLPTNFWRDPTKKVCYLSIVDGYVIDRMIDKFNEGLKDIIIDDTERMNHILDNMIYGISSTESNTRRVKWLSQIKNIYTRNILEEDISDMPKFDFIVQNPPYNGSLHLDFFNKGLDLLSDKGQMIIIEPSTWLIELRQYVSEKKSRQMKMYLSLKDRIKGHIKKIIIDNYNKEFNTGLYMPYSISFIDKAKQYDTIEYILFGNKYELNNINNCNLIGNVHLIKSIFNKIKNYDIVKNHFYIPNKSKQIKGNYYCKIALIVSNGMCGMGNRFYSDAQYRKWNNIWYLLVYTAPLFHSDTTSDIQNYPNERRTRGGVKIKNSEAECITGTKKELENWKYYVFNNSLPLFLNICLTIDTHNNSLNYVPWLVDKKYTDQEIYDMFNFTEKEIKLIETTIKKYERNSPWFKRYMCGPSEVTDEEVQNFIEDLNNVKR